LELHHIRQARRLSPAELLRNNSIVLNSKQKLTRLMAYWSIGECDLLRVAHESVVFNWLDQQRGL